MLQVARSQRKPLARRDKQGFRPSSVLPHQCQRSTKHPQWRGGTAPCAPIKGKGPKGQGLDSGGWYKGSATCHSISPAGLVCFPCSLSPGPILQPSASGSSRGGRGVERGACFSLSATAAKRGDVRGALLPLPSRNICYCMEAHEPVSFPQSQVPAPLTRKTAILHSFTQYMQQRLLEVRQATQKC